MTVILKGEGNFSDRMIHRECSTCIGLYAIALATLFSWGCSWYDISLDSNWILGEWVRSYSWAPYSDLLDFEADGKCYWYENYDGSDLRKTGTWSLSGDILTVDEASDVITKISDDHYLYKGFIYYRQFTEPGGDVFDQTATELTYGAWKAGTIAIQTLKLYTFSASGAGVYEISWDDQFDGSGDYSSDIIVSAYEVDKQTPILKFPPDLRPFTEEDDGYDKPISVVLTSGETVYIIVDAYYQGGSFRITVY